MALELFIDKKFSAAHRQLIKQANAIIEEYAKQGYRLTLRQIHYQFVARDWYENTFANYKRLGNVLDAARKAGRVDWDGIEDTTRSLRRIAVWDRPEQAVERLAEMFKLDPWERQDTRRRIEVWAEKDAAVSIIRPTCDDLRISYFSCRGYSSSSGLYEAGKRLKSYQDAGYETLVLYLGDHDPSGVQMGHSTQEKICLFADCEIEFRRIALTMDQIKQYDPPANFAKETDSRTKWYVETFGTEDAWELDALAPKVIDALIREHVEPLRDMEAWDQTMAEEQDHLATFQAMIDDWGRTKAAPDMLEYIRSVSGEPVEGEELADGTYAEADTATLVRVIDGADEIVSRHNL
jgi:hypothetical protein